MVARSTDGHKTNASLVAELLGRVGMVMLPYQWGYMDDGGCAQKKARIIKL